MEKCIQLGSRKLVKKNGESVAAIAIRAPDPFPWPIPNPLPGPTFPYPSVS